MITNSTAKGHNINLHYNIPTKPFHRITNLFVTIFRRAYIEFTNNKSI